MNEQTLRTFHPNVRPFIREVMINGRIGIGAGNLRIADVQTGRPTIETSENGDRFKLSIPFAGQLISWEIVFNSYRPSFPPDFCFHDESFLSDPEVNILEENVPSLAKWDAEDPKSLLHVISELLALYRKHQVSLLNGVDYSRIYFEYSSLVCQAQVLEEDVEVLIGTRNNKSRLLSGAVNFLIKLKVDFSSLPPIVSNENPGENAAMLLVTFHSPEGSRITPQLHLAPSVEKALGSFQLPPFPPDGSCLMDYVPVVVEQLQEKVSNIANCFEKKKEYFAALFYRLGKSVVEYDGVTFTRATFILEWRDFYFLVHFTLPAQFPLDRPMLLFQSVYHIAYGNPYQTWVDDYPYSPRWLPNEMVDRVYNYILEHAEVFQKKSIQSSQG
ncbi:BRISC and BRCA1-A complex member 2 isoform X3 [Anabrus simplex]|uniref:BRISC and BRCA1-A complex member 2 isoform X3 n=1 Tax=Anabrus simplex TaxID=316456 RepID=UPI0034DD81AF